MEKLTGYTCNPDYMMEWNKLMNQKDHFINQISGTNMRPLPCSVNLQGFGEIQVEHLRQHSNVSILQQAFDLKMRMVAYWKIFKVRLVDSMALHLQYRVHNLVNNDIDEIVKELMGPEGHGIEKMLVESPAVVAKREKLKNSIKVLKESKDSVAKIMDRIVLYDAYLV
ncbi:dynamin-related protein 4C-like [Gossypium hirsutum]|uniref:Dynamin-related protein 4C-like n=2 Tax=Gossypium TaxID=3633 RepID=A0ABM2ZDU6_GOSHI|nr:dynamin-related protein 4C-like [Gossypium hirsutum]